MTGASKCDPAASAERRPHRLTSNRSPRLTPAQRPRRVGAALLGDERATAVREDAQAKPGLSRTLNSEGVPMLHLVVDAVRPDPRAIARAAESIRAGELVAFPTETVYGLGADALRSDAVAGIFQAKGRPPDNPLIVHIADADQLSQLCTEVSETARMLAHRFWPGPLTLVLRRRPDVPDVTTAGLDTVAIRVPDHPVAIALLRACDRPIAAPSANRSGRPSPTRAAHVLEDLGEQVAVILDAGPCPIGLESTVVDVSRDPPVILRTGAVSIEALRAVAAETRAVEAAETTDLRRSPGTRYRHYAPRARVVLAPAGEAGEMALRLQRAGSRVGLISRQPFQPDQLDLVTPVFASSLEDYAAALFTALRDLDRSGCTVIVAESVEEEGIGRAVMDRLRRAASHPEPDDA